MITLAKDLAAALEVGEGRATVAVAPLESDTKALRPDALAVLVGTQLAGQRGWDNPRDPESVANGITRARGSQWLVYVRVRIEGGRLRASADVHPVPSTVWARARNPNPAPVAHAFADTPIDAEVRSFLEPVPLVAPFDFKRGKNFELGVLALACDDFDRDGAPEIVSVSRNAVTLSRIREGKVSPVVAKLWSDLSTMDPTPLREPIATAFSAPPPRTGAIEPLDVVVSITDRVRSVRLGTDLSTRASFPGFAIKEGGAFSCARLPALTITGPLDSCAVGEASPKRSSVTGRFDALAAADLVEVTGAPYEVWAGREDTAVEIRDDKGKFARIASAGAQLAIGDIDQDGSPEILTSLDVERGTADAVVVYTWDRSSKTPPKEQMRIPVAAGVYALAMCPPIGPGRTPFLIATADEIVVAR
ncbi:MAG: hypothetical protein HOW73_20955 [Polyangiaceae bacterium]|nr:hypothetical protein [Polyangiaceae bacterium]